MNKPDIEILSENAKGNYNGVYIDGKLLCLCHTDIKSDAIRSMLEALIQTHNEARFDALGGYTKAKIKQALNKSGVEL